MIDFSKLPLGSSLHNLLDGIRIDFAFQAILNAATMEVAGYEALMRPEGMTPFALIERCREENSLHTLELATFIGATKAFLDKGLQGFVSINSLPSECLTPEESGIYFKCFPNLSERLYVEILEYTDLNLDKWLMKKGQIRSHGMKVAVDDYGSGNNFMLAVNLFEPDIIKTDRKLIAGIHNDIPMQEHFIRMIERFHERGSVVIAEGVECLEEFDFLRTTKVDYLQGFYLGRPQM
ncbi:MAG: EAL domain-containing protein [Lachnospiraceae bacterium]|nr:EAL domain-containing protein [Acetatifactor muris]MCM1218830.1 EAL domain-containing protein [Lachnospiraceae bacterium]